MDMLAAMKEIVFLAPDEPGTCGKDHFVSMLQRASVGNFSQAKLGRWLGYMQGVLVAKEISTLDEMKELNRKYSEIAHEAPPLPAEVEEMRKAIEAYLDETANPGETLYDGHPKVLLNRAASLLSRWPGVWRPIESAPLGQWLLLAGYPWGDNYPPIAVGRGTKVISEWWEQISSTQKELHAETITQWEVEGLTPTHWQPIPEPPHE